MAFTGIPVFLLVAVLTLTLIGVLPVASKQHHHHHHHQICSEPADLQEQWNRLHAAQMHETFYLMPFLRDAAINETQRYNFSMNHFKRTAVFNVSSEYPGSNKEEDVLRDPCPVYHTLNTDPNRYPHVLLEAQCRCTRCQGIKAKASQGKVVPTCEGVHYHVRALRRLADCVDNVYQYATAWEKVQVGCACHLVPKL